MSAKRKPTSELNHDNWDEDDEPVERGEFRKATDEELKSRVIKKARRKVTQDDAGGSDTPKKTIFGDLSGFKKSTSDTTSGGSASPYAFLAKHATQDAASLKLQLKFGSAAAATANKDAEKPSTSTTAATYSFSFFPQTTSSSTTTTAPTPLPTFSFNTSKNASDKTSSAKVTSSSIFSSNASKFNYSSGNSLFTTSNRFSGIGTSPQSNPEFKKSIFGGDSKLNTNKEEVAEVSQSSDKKSLEFRSNLKILNEQFSEWIQKQVKENPLCILTPVFKDYVKHINDIGEEIITSDSEHPVEKKICKDNDKKQLNNNAEEIINSKSGQPVGTNKAVEVVICLSDDDDDEDEEDENDDESSDSGDVPSSSSGEKSEEKKFGSSIVSKSASSSIEKPALASFMNPAPLASPMFSFGLKKTNDTDTKKQEPPSSTTSKTTSPMFSFGLKKTNDTETKQQEPLSSTTSPSKISSPIAGIFSFGANKPNDTETKQEKSPSSATTTTTSNVSSPLAGIYSFGAKKPTESPDSNGFKSDIKPIGAPMFGFGSSSTSTSTGGVAAPAAPFSFGSGTVPFSFGNIQPPAAATASSSTANPDDDEDTPPKVEFNKVVEEDAIYSKKCKVYVKKEDNFVDRGVGTLYLKPVKDSEKTQLIVRADTNLGNILVNLILSKGLPCQLKGKNNVMLVCLPTPEAEKPTPTLFRVKTNEDANELLELIKKHTK